MDEEEMTKMVMLEMKRETVLVEFSNAQTDTMGLQDVKSQSVQVKAEMKEQGCGEHKVMVKKETQTFINRQDAEVENFYTSFQASRGCQTEAQEEEEKKEKEKKVNNKAMSMEELNLLENYRKEIENIENKNQTIKELQNQLLTSTYKNNMFQNLITSQKASFTE